MRAPLFLILTVAITSGAGVTTANAADIDTAWVRFYNGAANRHDNAYAAVRDASGNTYVTGGSQASGHAFFDYDMLTIKYDAAGDTVWLRRLNFPGDINEQGRLAMLTDDSHLICVGDRVTATLIVKYTTAGDTVWTRSFTGSSGLGAFPLDGAFTSAFGGEYFVTGTTPNGTDNDVFTLCYAPNGTLLWSHEFDGGSQDNAKAIAINALGQAYVTLYSESGGNQNIVTIKYNTNGSVAWTRSYNGPSNLNDQGVDIAVDANGDVIVLGLSSTAVAVNDFVLLKYEPDGDTAWVRIFDGPAAANDLPKSLVVEQTDIFVSGDVGTSPGITKLGLLKYNASGDTVWARYHQPYVNVRAMTTDASGDVLLTGEGVKAGIWGDWGTFKFTPAGDTAWFRWLLGPILPAGTNTPRAIVPDGAGGVVVAGSFQGTMQDFATAYYVPDCSCPNQCDFNVDTVLDATDLNSLIDALFFGGINPQDPACPTTRADFNADGFPDAVDLNELIDHLFFGGPAPADPCGP